MAVAKKHHDLYGELGNIVGAEYVSDNLAVLLSYTRDVSTFPPSKPQGAIVRPGSVEEVVELVRLANQTRTPLIPMGGKGSLSGLPPGQPGRGIIVDMRRMDKVIEIDEANMAVTTQCGIILSELRDKVNERGFDIHTAEMSPHMFTVGGQLSGFPGGGFSRYAYSIGSNWHYLLGLKVVLPNGKIIDTGTGEGAVSTYRGHTWARSMHGPDMTGTFVGDGGIFGIKCEATFRMFRPVKFEKAGVRFWESLDEAYQAHSELSEIDPLLYAQPYAKALILSPEFADIVGAEPAWFFFWLSIGNSEEEVELKYKTVDSVCDKHGGKVAEPAVVATLKYFMTERVLKFGTFATMGRSPFFELFLSRRDLMECLRWSREYVFNWLTKRGIDRSKIRFLGCIFTTGPGYGLTSMTPHVDQSDQELCKAVHEMWMEFLEQARRRGYIMEGTQGQEARFSAKSWTPEFYDYTLTLKKTLDPNNIMNPGVYFL